MIRRNDDRDTVYHDQPEVAAHVPVHGPLRPAIRLRKALLFPFSCRWNAWVRDITARLDR